GCTQSSNTSRTGLSAHTRIPLTYTSPPPDLSTPSAVLPRAIRNFPRPKGSLKDLTLTAQRIQKTILLERVLTGTRRLGARARRLLC
ncbi:hypothetical protein FRB90_005792, partial [Tulasnella sp. 427]